MRYLILFFCIITSIAVAKENFFERAKTLYENKKYDESKFLFQRNIVFNPKHANSYLYLAKIYGVEENQYEEKKNLNTTLLLEPNNEEAIYMLINIELKRSNYSKVKELTTDFKLVCNKLCKKLESINKRLENIDSKDDS